MQGKTAALHNLGCKVNAYELQAMQELLEAAGYTIVPFQDRADVYVVNTCTVTNIADRKSRQMLHRAKKQNPEAVVVATGCYAQTGTKVLQADESVDIILGNDRKGHLIEVLQAFQREKQAVDILTIASSREYEPLSITRTAEHTRAFVKVTDGCNQFCSYCLIPYARGRVRSRPLSDVVEEVRGLSLAGYQEVVLTGIHLSSYGVDFKGKRVPEGSGHEGGQQGDQEIGQQGNQQGDQEIGQQRDQEHSLLEGEGGSTAFLGNEQTLLSLIQAVSQVPGITRIRLGSLEPGIITPDFVQGIQRIPQLCPHFHLSLQSGCDETLRRMNRRYTSQEFYERTQLLRAAFEDPALTTDVIVGFPGETQEDFESSRAFVDKVDFYETHIFPYAKRDGTRAAAMAGQLSEAVKQERSQVLLSLGKEKIRSYEERHLGKTLSVLLEEPLEIEGRAYLLGHSREYIPVAIPASQGEVSPGQEVRVHIQGFLKEHLLTGKRI